MATRPATAPEQMPTTVGLPRSTHSTNIQVSAAAAVAIWVTVIAMPACMPAVTAEPALKPNQPTHSSEAPMKVSTTLWAGPVSLRLPSMSAHIRPATPELTCTTVPPAKSSTLTKASVLAEFEEAVRSPHPMRDRRIDEDRPQADEPQHGRELHALGEGAGDQRRRDDREGHLEADVDGLGDRRRERVRIADALRDVAEHVLQEGAVEPADEGRAGAEGHAVGADRPEHRDQAGDGEARHHGVADVLLAHHAAVEQAEARHRHHQHQRHRGEHPGGVAGIGRALLERLGVAGRRRGLGGRRGRRRGAAAGAWAWTARRREERRRDQQMATRSPNMRAAAPHRSCLLIILVAPVRSGCCVLERGLVGLAGADAHRVFERITKILPSPI